MNLVRQRERHERESALGKVYRAVMDKLQAAVEYNKLKHSHRQKYSNSNCNCNCSYNNNNVLYYRAMDLKHVADQAWNAVTAAAESDMLKTKIYAGSFCKKANRTSSKCNAFDTNNKNL